MNPPVSAMPERPDVEIEARRPLTRRETIELAVRQGGRCGCGCGFRLDALSEGVIDEHVLALTLGGTNDLANRALWRKPCAQDKTKWDRSANDKVRRLRGETCAGEPARKLQGRGFGDRTRKFNGEVSLTKAARRQAEGGCDKLAGYEPKANAPKDRPQPDSGEGGR
ncbi:hypothetical protein [Brevundimonas sp. Root1279]|uniref:hypothetical protein n=1 Tax=Brevundimonas sp. Root1279 TaxID=1736443 RepID=UPI0006F94363|nr:hypothetical protein [Brevundimonas sp. Root1279]KQW79754.1 hypothetical protein ASC65_14495 [Brevundimonas sp. Root1279]